MASLEERVSVLEGRVEEQSRNFHAIDARIQAMNEDLGGRMSELGVRIADVEKTLGVRITDVEKTLGARISEVERNLNGRIDALDAKADRFRVELTGGIAALDQKMSRHFLWLAGFQFTVLVAVIAARA